MIMQEHPNELELNEYEIWSKYDYIVVTKQTCSETNCNETKCNDRKREIIHPSEINRLRIELRY